MAEEEKPKHPGGRPRMYDSPEALQKKITEYFENCPDFIPITLKDGTTVKVPTITISGLVLYCGFCDRRSFYDYEKFPEFAHTIKKARTFIEMEYEKLLRTGNCTGAIFALKNFGWVDRTENATTMTFKQMPTIIDDNGKEMEFKCGEDPA